MVIKKTQQSISSRTQLKWKPIISHDNRKNKTHNHFFPPCKDWNINNKQTVRHKTKKTQLDWLTGNLYISFLILHHCLHVPRFSGVERRNKLEDEIGKCWYFAVFPVACIFITTSGSSLSPSSTPFSLTLLN